MSITKDKDPNRHTNIRPDVLEQVYEHARATYPEECCGVLMGPRETCSIVDEARPCENVQNKLHQQDPIVYPRDARTAYNIGPRDLFFMLESFETARPVKVIYHSHANVGAYFSEEDKRMALALFEIPTAEEEAAGAKANGEPAFDISYLVVDARHDRIPGAKLFRWDPISQEFLQTAEFQNG